MQVHIHAQHSSPYLSLSVSVSLSLSLSLSFSFGFQRRQSLIFTLPSSPFFLPACFFCLVSYLLKRLSLHGSPNWKIMDLINWSLSAIDTIFSRRSLGSGEPVCSDGTSRPDIRGMHGRGGKSYVWRLFLWRTRGNLPFRHHDNRYSADWIRLCPGLSENSEDGNSCPKSHKAARLD